MEGCFRMKNCLQKVKDFLLDETLPVYWNTKDFLKEYALKYKSTRRLSILFLGVLIIVWALVAVFILGLSYLFYYFVNFIEGNIDTIIILVVQGLLVSFMQYLLKLIVKGKK